MAVVGRWLPHIDNYRVICSVVHTYIHIIGNHCRFRSVLCIGTSCARQCTVSVLITDCKV